MNHEDDVIDERSDMGQAAEPASPALRPSERPTADVPVAAATADAGETRPAAREETSSRQLRPTVIAIAAAALVFTVASGCFFGGHAAAGVAVGGLLATLNFILFIRLVQAFLTQGGNTAGWTVLAFVKLLGLFAVVYVVLKQGSLPPLALAIGYASLPIGISLGSLVRPRDAATGS